MEEDEEVQAKAETHQFPHIPEEIILRILSKLPVKSLLRFRCVSNRWRFLISDRKFSLSIHRPQIVVMPIYNLPRVPIRLIDDEGSVMEIPKPNPLVNRRGVSCLSIRGSCGGLLLLKVDGDLFLWNPLTGSCSQMFSCDWLMNSIADFWLCCDSSVDQYKAFGIFHDTSSGDDKAIMVSLSPYNANDSIVMAGSFNEKKWIEICFPYSKKKVQSGPMVNGRLHLLVIESIDDEEDDYCRPDLIVCLDPQRNEIARVPMPDRDKKGDSILVIGLGALDGCLSLVLWMDDQIQSRDVEVLAMKRYGDKSSWTRLFIISDVIDLHPCVNVVPLCITKNGVVLLLVDDDTILAFNPMENLHWHLPLNNIWSSKAAVFVESLASPMIYNWEDED